MTVVYFAVECQVEFDYEAELPDELSIRTGEVITAVKQMEGGWWEGTCKGKRGLFPDNFVKVRQGKHLITQDTGLLRNLLYHDEKSTC